MKRILITRPRAQADAFADRLRAAGFEPVFLPVIHIQAIENNAALERAISKLNCYEWVVFTSVNAVETVFDQASAAIESAHRQPERVKIAAVGPKTAEALQRHAITPDFVPEEYVPEAILPGMGDLLGKWILLPRAEIARKALPEMIFAAGGVPHEITVYKTLPTQPDPEGITALQAGVDAVTLTSPSTVQNFIAIAEQHGLDPLHLPNDPLFACIGPVTEQAAREAGLPNIVVAKEYTSDGLLEILKNLEVS